MITKDSWCYIMLNMMDVSYKFIAVIYAVIIIVVTSDFIVNIILGVFCEVFKDAKLKNDIQKIKELE